MYIQIPNHKNYCHVCKLVRANYQKPPLYCRSLCTDRRNKKSSKIKMHAQKKEDNSKKKDSKKRALGSLDAFLLSNYKNGYIPTGQEFKHY